MKQYCRYCCWLTIGDCYYCQINDEVMSTAQIRRPNRCPSFELSVMGDIETGKQYRPRAEKHCDYDQLTLSEEGCRNE